MPVLMWAAGVCVHRRRKQYTMSFLFVSSFLSFFYYKFLFRDREGLNVFLFHFSTFIAFSKIIFYLFPSLRSFLLLSRSMFPFSRSPFPKCQVMKVAMATKTSAQSGLALIRPSPAARLVHALPSSRHNYRSYYAMISQTCTNLISLSSVTRWPRRQNYNIRTPSAYQRIFQKRPSRTQDAGCFRTAEKSVAVASARLSLVARLSLSYKHLHLSSIAPFRLHSHMRSQTQTFPPQPPSFFNLRAHYSAGQACVGETRPTGPRRSDEPYPKWPESGQTLILYRCKWLVDK